MRPLEAHDPRSIGAYTVLGVLGQGGMGKVYLGQSWTGKRVAIKVIRSEIANDPVFRQRAVLIKEQRAELVKHHLWVLWTDYFKPEHLEAHPDLHDLFWQATKEAGEAKNSVDPKQGKKLLDLIGKIDKIFWATKKSEAKAA